MKFTFTSRLSGRILSGYFGIFFLAALSVFSVIVVKDQLLLNLMILTSLLLCMILSVISIYLVNKYVIRAIKEIDEALLKASKGEKIEHMVHSGNGEIGNIQQSIRSMIEGLNIKSVFASEIGKGNYDYAFKPLSEYDTIGASLLNMRDNLRTNAVEETKRSWATMGQAQIGEILQKNYGNIQQFYDNILAFVVKYLEANQGALFVIDHEQAGKSLDLVSCYAYQRKKYQHKKVTAGEGLVGQAFRENDTILLTEIPQDYLLITSGLGMANPSCLMIVPMKTNNDTYGIIELASFKVFEKYQVAFVEKIADSIASTIANVKTNEVTHKLLDESRIQTEQMRAQEEEMRQNMEELQATQENQLRLQEELKANEEIMKVSLQELQEAKEHLEKKEVELLQANEKSQAKANKFREKMEDMDLELENKDAQINVLAKENEELLEKLSKYENQ